MSIRTSSVVTILLSLSGLAYSADKAPTPAPGTAPLGSTWADAARMPDFFAGMWMTYSAMVEKDATLDVPYTPKAQKYVDAYQFKRDIPYAQDGCASPGLPIGMRAGPLKFTYSPGMVSIYMQAVGHTRFIRLNQPMGKTSPKYYGNSVGHFEGDTLVVETNDFLPEISFQYGIGKGLPPDGTIATAGIGDIGATLSKAIWGTHGEGMRMVERMRLLNPDSLEIQLTLYDDTVWTRPYVTAARTFRHLQKGISEGKAFDGEPQEWVCTVSITSFDPDTNTYHDKNPEDMVKYLDKLGR